MDLESSLNVRRSKMLGTESIWVVHYFSNILMCHLTSRLCEAKIRSPWQPSVPLIHYYELIWIRILATSWNVWSLFCLKTVWWWFQLLPVFGFGQQLMLPFFPPPVKRNNHLIVEFVTSHNRFWLYNFGGVGEGWSPWYVHDLLIIK